MLDIFIYTFAVVVAATLWGLFNRVGGYLGEVILTIVVDEYLKKYPDTSGIRRVAIRKDKWGQSG